MNTSTVLEFKGLQAFTTKESSCEILPTWTIKESLNSNIANSLKDFLLDTEITLANHNKVNLENDDYTLLSLNTIQGVIGFLEDHLMESSRQFNFIPIHPVITPLYDGSIDIYWKNNKLEFLINFIFDTTQSSLMGDFYSTTNDGNEFKGNVKLFKKQIFPPLLYCLSNSR